MKTRLLKNALIGLALVAVQSQTANAQEGFNCGTDLMMEKLYQQHPELRQAQIDYNNEIIKAAAEKKEQKATESVYIIPVVFHIIHTYGTENISDAQVLDQVAILNRDFRKLNADITAAIPFFQGIAADTKIEFRLPKLDPNGNCTNGIDRIYSHKTNSANDLSKLNPWPRNKYLNVWVVRSMESVGTAGYAYYPGATSGFLSPFDGIIILHDYIGSVGTGSVFRSRALTHEVGHWLNLPHTWGSTNNPNVACGDDLVNDTPVTKGHDNCNNRTDYFCDSQTLTAVYDFSNVTTSTGTIDPTATPNQINTTSNLAVELTSFNAMGVSANSSVSGAFGFSDWDTGALNAETVYANLTGSLNTAKYYEFKVKPIAGQAMTLTGITFNIKRDTSGVRTFAVRSSVGGFAANLTSSVTPANPLLSVQAGNTFFITMDTTNAISGSKITLSGASYTNIYDSLTFRIYGFNAEDAAGSFEIDNVTISGTFGTMENVENYMEYSYCSKLFTTDQKLRMRTALESTVSARNNLWINSNLTATGISPATADCKAKPDFFVTGDKRWICKGTTITFQKNIMHGTPTSLLWRFPGSTATPTSTSTAATVNVVYDQVGVWPVTLVATNASGVDSVVKTEYITVSNPWGDFMGNGYTENFENANSFWYYWKINNMDNNANTFTHVNYTGYNSSKSLLMNAYQNYNNDVDEIISPSFNLAYVTPATLSFKYAGSSHGTVAADIQDALKVYYSITCGNSWTILPSGTISNATLANNGYSAGFFTPTSASQWTTKTINLPTSANNQNVRFKFVFEAGPEPNNLYIDDININGVVGIAENTNTFDLMIFPNPTNQSTSVSYHLTQKGNVKLEVVDVLGKTIVVPVNTTQSEGDYKINLSKTDNNFSNGVYFIRLTVDNVSTTRKLIITE